MRTGGPDRSSGPRAPAAEHSAHDEQAFDEPTPFWRSPTPIAAVSGLLLIGTVLADLAISTRLTVLTVFLGFAPLVASAALGPAGTASFAITATALAAVSGLWNQVGPQYWVRLTDVAVVGALAVGVSATRVRRETDLRASRHIASVAQQALLPVLPERIGSTRFVTRYHSATRAAQVGGDFFDFVADADRVRVILGDVSGKGVDAVTQAARAIRAFRQYAASETDLLGVTRRIDAYVSPFWKWEYYATAVLVELSEADTLTVVSAGHPPPFHVSGGMVRELAVRPCLPLGLGAGDEVSVHVWDPGDRLLLYTDGLVEARDPSGRFLPRAAIDAALRMPDPDASVDALLDGVHAHAGRFADDLALLLMAKSPPPADTVAPPTEDADQGLDRPILGV